MKASAVASVCKNESFIADRIIERTIAISTREMQNQVLDYMDTERECGITIKNQAARLNYIDKDGTAHTLNLIDTPGHIIKNIYIDKPEEKYVGFVARLHIQGFIETLGIESGMIVGKNKLSVLV